MRLAPLVALLLAAPALHAQPCTPDSVPASAYYPLNVGDEWIYHAPAFTSTPELFVQRRVLRADAATGRPVEQICTFSAQNGARACAPERIARVPDGLDAPLGSSPTLTCAPDYGTSVVIGGRTYTVARVKGLPGYTDFAPPPFAAGIGPIGFQVGNLVERTDRFEYARIGGVAYGTRPAGVPTPDLTPPQDYYPLEVGNEWIYRYTERSVNGTGDNYVRRRVLREEVAGGQTYAVDQECVYNNLAAAPSWVCEPERLVRFDPATTDIVGRNTAGGEYPVLCNLGADFGPSPGPSNACAQLGYLGYQPSAVEIGGISYPVPSAKVELTLANVGPPGLFAGIGPGANPVGDFRTSSFTFARVRGVEYGARPVGGEGEAAPAETFVLAATPNPTAGALRLAITLPKAGTVRLEAFDALGRRVWQQAAALGAGAQRVSVDASAWAPGLYVVRAVAGSASASARVVRR